MPASLKQCGRQRETFGQFGRRGRETCAKPHQWRRALLNGRRARLFEWRRVSGVRQAVARSNGDPRRMRAPAAPPAAVGDYRSNPTGRRSSSTRRRRAGTACAARRDRAGGRRCGRRRRSGCPIRRRPDRDRRPSKSPAPGRPSAAGYAGDQLRRRPRAEAVVARRVGRGELHDSQAIAAVGQIGELADVSDPELHVAQVVDAAAGVVNLVDPRSLGVGDVENHQALADRRRHRHRCGRGRCSALRAVRQRRDRPRMGEVRDVEHLHPFVVADEGIAELHLHSPRIVQHVGRRSRQ